MFEMTKLFKWHYLLRSNVNIRKLKGGEYSWQPINANQLTRKT